MVPENVWNYSFCTVISFSITLSKGHTLFGICLRLAIIQQLSIKCKQKRSTNPERYGSCDKEAEDDTVM